MINILQKRPLCLASSSPRRKMFLEKFNLQFECHKPKIEEKPKSDENAKNFVKRMANEKAQYVNKKFYKSSKDIVVLSGDTIVFINSQILGKPLNAQEAKKMLQLLSNKTHKVFSGFSIFDSKSKIVITDVISTEVTFQKLDESKIEWYIKTKEPFGKAGSYSIQGLGSILIKSISGSYNNVVGFPIEHIFPYLIKNGCITFGVKK
tara:strand:- start:19 stop:636 length:618 start_codon:yes stop_codon:yes gene_type:complete